jgi:hypothetical protein
VLVTPGWLMPAGPSRQPTCPAVLIGNPSLGGRGLGRTKVLLTEPGPSTVGTEMGTELLRADSPAVHAWPTQALARWCHWTQMLKDEGPRRSDHVLPAGWTWTRGRTRFCFADAVNPSLRSLQKPPPPASGEGGTRWVCWALLPLS